MAYLVFDLLFLLLLIIANAFFAMSEMALLSARKTKLEQMSLKGDSRASLALSLTEKPLHFFSIAQFVMTFVGVVAGAFGGVTVAKRLEQAWTNLSNGFPGIHFFSLVSVVFGIVFLMVIVGEIVPKRLALREPEKILVSMSKPLTFIIALVEPLIRFLTSASDVILKLVNYRVPASRPRVTSDEIKLLVAKSVESGELDQVESMLISRVVSLDDMHISAIMTPRHKVAWLDLSQSREQIFETVVGSFNSHYPVCEGSLDHFFGVVETQHLLPVLMSKDSRFDIRELARQPVFVPEFLPVLETIELFKRKKLRLVIIVNEYGHIQGLATSSDIMKAVVGEISNASHPPIPPAHRREGGWVIDAHLDIEQLAEMFNLLEISPEERARYGTVGRLAFAKLGRVPQCGDLFDWKGLEFEILEMVGNRIDKIHVSLYGQTKRPLGCA